MIWSVLEPGEEIEWFAEVATVIEPARHGRQVFEPSRDMPRSLLEDLAALLLGQLPPGFRLPNRNERRQRCFHSAESLLAHRQRRLLGSIHVALIGRHSAENPARFDRGRSFITLEHGKPRRGCK